MFSFSGKIEFPAQILYIIFNENNGQKIRLILISVLSKSEGYLGLTEVTELEIISKRLL